MRFNSNDNPGIFGRKVGTGMKPSRFWILLILLGAFLSACAGTQSSSLFFTQNNLQIWIDAPLFDEALAQEPYKLVFHGASPDGIDNFEISINGIAEGSLPASKSALEQSQNDTLYLGEYLWSPPAPGTYFISVSGFNPEGLTASAEARVYVLGDLAEIPDAEIPPEVPVISTHTPTPAPYELLAEAIQDSNCRYGCQASQFDIADTLLESIQYPINAFSTDGFYAQFIGPVTGQYCWVPLSLLDLQLNGISTELQGIPVELVNYISCPLTPEPPTPTNTPVPTTKTPFPASTVPECDDGVDNDSDGAIDLADPQCRSADDDSELNP